MALAITVGVVSLIAILAVATLSLAGRLVQTSTLSLRDAHLDAGAAFGLSAVSDQWRERHLGRLAIGASSSFDISWARVPVAVKVTVTRVAAEVYWVAAEAKSQDGAVRRENLILRARVPGATTLIGDSANVETLGFVIIDSMAVAADLQLPAGSIVSPQDGVIHIKGDATLAGGTGSGVLVVEGRLTVTGPLSYEGVVVARGGISIVVPGVTITGIVRAAGAPSVQGNMTLIESGEAVQGVLLQALRPRPVTGRRWAELH